MTLLAVESSFSHAVIETEHDTRRARDGRWTNLSALRALHIVLCNGFHEHTVNITVDGRQIYHRSGVTTTYAYPADMLEVATTADVAHISVAAIPGPFHGSIEVDLSVHPRVAISLVGDGTVSFEPSSSPFRDRWPG